METVSALASIGSLADITVRASIVIYDRFRKVKNAPRNMRCLLTALNTFTTDLIGVANEFKSSPFAVEDHQAMPEVDSILRDCQSEMKMLQSIADAAASAEADPWFWWGKRHAHWVFDCQQVEDACKRLEQHRSALKTALALLGR